MNHPSQYETLAIETVDQVQYLTLNRPERLNAMNSSMLQELTGHFTALARDPSVRVVVMKGAGRSFCAGVDLSDVDRLLKAGMSETLSLQQEYAHLIRLMRRCPQPIIVLLHGSASGIGLALALAADIRYAAASARMNVANIRIGLSGCDVGISYFLPRIVGASNAAEIMMSGAFVDADKALRIGLVSRLCQDDELDGQGRDIAAQLVSTAPAALKITKDGLNASMDGASLETILSLEDRGQTMCVGAYLQEGVQAFFEKRAPSYR